MAAKSTPHMGSKRRGRAPAEMWCLGVSHHPSVQQRLSLPAPPCVGAPGVDLPECPSSPEETSVLFTDTGLRTQQVGLPLHMRALNLHVCLLCARFIIYIVVFANVIMTVCRNPVTAFHWNPRSQDFVQGCARNHAFHHPCSCISTCVITERRHRSSGKAPGGTLAMFGEGVHHEDPNST